MYLVTIVVIGLCTELPVCCFVSVLRSVVCYYVERVGSTLGRMSDDVICESVVYVGCELLLMMPAVPDGDVFAGLASSAEADVLEPVDCVFRSVSSRA